MVFAVWVAVLMGLMGIVYLWLKNRWQLSRLPPGPTGWPLVGNAFQLDPLRPQKTLYELTGKYGELFTFNSFGNPVVMCNSFDAIWQMLVTKSNDFAGRPEFFPASYIHDMACDTAFSDFTPHWARRKKTFMTNIKMYGDGLHNLEAIMVDIIDELVKDIKDTKQEPFDPMEHIQLALANTLSLMLFGSKFRKDDPDFRKLLVYMEKGRRIMAPSLMFLALCSFPWLRHVPVEGCQRLDEFLNGFVKDWIPRQIKKRLANKCSDSPSCVLDGIMKQHEEDIATSAELSLERKHVVTMCENFIMAGMHTSSGAIYATLAILTCHPEIQAKAQAEIDQVLGNRSATLTDKKNMPYSQAMQEEVMRYAVVVALGIPHRTTVDTEICGHFLPKDTEVWPNVWYLCHDPNFWGDPWIFRPERFLDDEGDFVPIDHPSRKHVLTFGAGRRVCPGEVLAKNRMFLIFTSLLKKFTFKPISDDQMPECDPRTYTTGISVYPALYKIRAIPRD